MHRCVLGLSQGIQGQLQAHVHRCVLGLSQGIKGAVAGARAPLPLCVRGEPSDLL